MRKFLFLIAAIAVSVFASSSFGPAFAQAARTWVSGAGTDSGTCPRTAPCASFAYAITQTNAGGEINCLDPAGYGGLTITKSISIHCSYTEGGVLVAGTNGIVVQVGATDRVVLDGLDIEGMGTGLNGVNIIGTGSVIIRRSLINHFTGNGVNLVGTANAKALVQDSIISFNGGGVNVQGAGGVTNIAVIDHTTIETHTSFAVQAAQGGSAYISASNLIGTGTKLATSGNGTIISYGNNVIRGAGVPPTTTLPLQ